MIYDPAEDSFLLLKYIKRYANGKVLDLGTGSGVLAEEALKYTNDVLAADIDQDAVDFCNRKGIKAIRSDLFSDINGKFDLIIFNPPYLPDEECENPEIRRVVSGGKNGYEIIEKFLKNSREFLNEKGKILLLFSSLTMKSKIDDLIVQNSFKSRMLETKNLFFEKLYVYIIY